LTAKEYNESVKAWSGRLYGYILKSIKNADDANDIVQESYMKLWLHRKKVDFDKSKAWLFTTAYRTMLNQIKKESRKTSLNGFNGKEPHTNGNPRFELKEIINKCLDKLPRIQKSIILLRDLEGYNYKEIGEILDLSESQVKVYLFRGRQKMKNQILNHKHYYETY